MIVVLVLLMAGLVSSDITCPDGHTCPDNNTCCLTDQGYACCPAPNAVCCPGQEYCCPHGYKCDPSSPQGCVKQGLPWYDIFMPLQKAVEETEEKPSTSVVELSDDSSPMVHCDSYYTCPDGTTCCRSPYGHWTCCPYNMGQCCRDGIHCCPHGYHCDSTSTRCMQGELSNRSSSPQPAMLIQAKQKAVEETEEKPSATLVELSDDSSPMVHCDSSYTCPDGTTCCRTPYGRWACCPYNMGQCCRDGIHCCPHGYHCDSTSTRCTLGALSIRSSSQQPAMLIQEQKAVEETEEKPSATLVELSGDSSPMVHCDSSYTCPDGTTCCRTPYGRWACCPYNMGQCCRDGIHCCPHGYHCDSTSTRCMQGALSIRSSSPQPAMLMQNKQYLQEDQPAPLVPLEPALDNQVQEGVIRCNGRFYCPAEYTCCQAPTGEWGCCPYKLGQCCKDGKHCCEFGYNCDSAYSSCKKGYSRVPARPRKTAWFL
ncbi:progranulin isoform X3 [Astyanax mexicanus]|uniref:progranulin isoform X3 n=1 Tax=Astyanax mexicanus TaxID=7994 RepID=UPI0020CB38C4|nr:progranulin isoform X3 [Astyanax mexicanus]